MVKDAVGLVLEGRGARGEAIPPTGGRFVPAPSRLTTGQPPDAQSCFTVTFPRERLTASGASTWNCSTSAPEGLRGSARSGSRRRRSCRHYARLSARLRSCVAPDNAGRSAWADHVTHRDPAAFDLVGHERHLAQSAGAGGQAPLGDSQGVIPVGPQETLGQVERVLGPQVVDVATDQPPVEVDERLEVSRPRGRAPCDGK
jgi:hypothetical protein